MADGVFWVRDWQLYPFFAAAKAKKRYNRKPDPSHKRGIPPNKFITCLHAALEFLKLQMQKIRKP
ncbi:MAG: hypothetical protein EAY75_09655 [Bacteroidetes bacterium]|nr:MAG: hypothetical protein EAY75_09655 [Bacteroidota bacterium]